MKNIVKNRIKLLIAVIGVVMLTGSCKYKVIADDPYWPDQLIYMPAAVYNNFTIDATPAAIGVDPTPGYPTRFLVDTVARKFNVLLGVYRSGKDNKGSFSVDIAVNTDTITKLQAIVGKLPAGTLLLTSDKYSIPTSVDVKDGSDIGKFELSIDLDFLRANYIATTGQTYALAVGVSSTARKTNPKLATTIIVINTKIMKPTASFTSAPSGTDPKTINFTNTSLYGMRSIWDFGDGSANKTTTAAVNEAVSHTYTTGTYTIKLTVQGVADWADKSVFTAVRVIP
jgi:hypothetical protein